MRRSLSIVLILSVTALLSGCTKVVSTNPDGAYSVQQTKDGGFILCGLKTDNNIYKVFLIKTDISGKKIWERTFNGLGFGCWAFSVQQTMDDGYILAGTTETSNASLDGYFIKTNSEGNAEWSKVLGSAGDDGIQSIRQTKDEGYIFTGFSRPQGAGSDKIWLVKTDVNGNVLWEKRLGSSIPESSQVVLQTKDGGCIITGYIDSYNGMGNALLIKTDANGNILWSKDFGGQSFDAAYSSDLTDDGGYIIAGPTWSYGAGKADVWLIKTDAYGNTQWNKTFGSTGSEIAYSVQQTSDEGYILAGVSYSYGVNYGDVLLIKTNTNGNEQWYKTYRGTGEGAAMSLDQARDGGYIIAGYTSSSVAGDNEVLLIKIDANGNKVWEETFGGTNNEEIISMDPTSGYILAGFTYSFGAGSNDFWLIKTAVEGNAPATSTPG